MIKGCYQIVSSNSIRITELPIGTWTQDYKEFLEDLIYEENPIVYIPQPSNDTIVTLWGSNYFIHQNIIKECSSSTDTTLFSYPEINAGLDVNPKDGCEPQTFILEGSTITLT